MKAFGVIALKEIRENLRDRRALFFALIYGPLLMPVLLLGPAFFAAKSHMVDFDIDKEIHVAGMENAPNLIQRLLENNLVAQPAPDDYRRQLLKGQLELVLEIPDNYEERLRSGKRAPLTLLYNGAESASKNTLQQTRVALHTYNNYLGFLRLSARGQDPQLISAFNVIEQDIANENPGDRFLSGVLYFLLVFNMVIGGYYLAVDSTAGERERNSLETLLSLPAPRHAIVIGKYLAVLAFVVTSIAVTLLSVFLMTVALPLHTIPLFASLTSGALVTAFLLVLPCSCLIASLLITAAAFTRSVKEAQTYLGLLLVIPMAPLGLARLLDIPQSPLVLAVPFLSQLELLERNILDNAKVMTEGLIAGGSTLLWAALLLTLAVAFYRSEKILGSS